MMTHYEMLQVVREDPSSYFSEPTLTSLQKAFEQAMRERKFEIGPQARANRTSHCLVTGPRDFAV